MDKGWRFQTNELKYISEVLDKDITQELQRYMQH